MVSVIPTCQQGGAPRLTLILARCSDMCGVYLARRHKHGYVSRDLGIGGGDDLHFRYCPDCGQIQGTFPLPTTATEDGRD